MLRFLIDWIAEKRLFDKGSFWVWFIVCLFLLGVVGGGFIAFAIYQPIELNTMFDQPNKETGLSERIDSAIFAAPIAILILLALGIVSVLIFVGSSPNKWDGYENFLGWGLGFITMAFIASFFAFIDYQAHWLIITVSIVVMAEIIFLADKRKPNELQKVHILRYTLWNKLACFFEAGIILPALLGAIILIFKIVHWAEQSKDIIMVWAGYGGLVAVGIIAVYLYIWLNSLKYQKALQEKEKPKRKRKKNKGGKKK